MNHVTVGESHISGKGVFAVKEMVRGEVILAIDDFRIVDDDHPVRVEQGENPEHCDTLPDGSTVLMPSPEGYINHGCEPNVFVYSAGRQRFLLAVRQIAPGEELLYDYAINAVDGKVWQCRCGAAACRGRHKCDFFALSPQRQLEYLPLLDPWFARVHEARVLRLLRAPV